MKRTKRPYVLKARGDQMAETRARIVAALIQLHQKVGPSQTTVSAVAELAKVPNIVGIKEATGSMERLADIKRQVGADFALLTGDDATTCEFILNGGHGAISVTANVVPAKMALIAGENVPASTILCNSLTLGSRQTPPSGE